MPSRLVMTIGFAAVLLGLGVAVAVHAVPMPLAASNTSAPKAATLTPSKVVSQPSVGANGTGSPMAPPVPVGAFATVRMKPTATPSKKPAAPVKTAAPVVSQPAAPPALTPIATAQNETPTGQNQLAWSEAILKGLGAPLTSANIISMGYWMQNESGGLVGENNPINVSEPGYGGWAIQAEGGGYNLMSYPTVQQGLDAIVAYLQPSDYAGIVSDLKAGVGLNDPSLASALSEYSGGGYSAIPDSWGASQGQPQTP